MEVRGKEATASTASEASLAIFCFREPLPLSAKLLVGIVSNLYSERMPLPYGKLQTPIILTRPDNSGEMTSDEHKMTHSRQSGSALTYTELR